MAAPKNVVWGTRLGFYLAAIGSAFGLGNLWRFPYVVSENGGGAFVLLYLLFAFLIGMPLLIAELSLGKISRSSLLPALKKLTGDRYQVRSLRDSRRPLPPILRWCLPWVGYGALIITVIVLSYYAVISGWVLHFGMQTLVSLVEGTPFHTDATMNLLLRNGWLQILLTGVHLALVAVIVGQDLEQGLEKWLGYSVPLFGLLLLILAFMSLSLDSARAAMRFLFYPDFSKLNASSLGEALGHVMFTLSIGFGTMVTFGSYLRDKSYLPTAGFRVCTLDSFISICAGVMIFPLVITNGDFHAGPELLFRGVPKLFSEVPGGKLFGVGFFLCLYLASLGASIGLLETVVANLREMRRVKRHVGAYTVAGLCLLFAVIPALSSSVLSSVRLGGRSLLEVLDATLINWLLPISALFVSQIVCWILSDHLKKAEFTDAGPGYSGDQLYSHWIFVLRYVTVPLIVIALVLQAVDLFIH